MTKICTKSQNSKSKPGLSWANQNVRSAELLFPSLCKCDREMTRLSQDCFSKQKKERFELASS